MKIALYGKKFSSDFIENFRMMFDIFQTYHAELYIHEDFSKFIFDQDVINARGHKIFHDHLSIPRDASFLFSLGGDGTFLETVNLVRDSCIPVIGINTGRLGFLANISREDICSSIEDLFAGKYTLENRSLLHVTTNNGKLDELDTALNEVTVHKSRMGMISIGTELDGEYLNTYWADGLIISTPTGSTAYSMSVGGPIVVPEANTFIISPIAPHNLTVRPIIVPDNKKIKLTVKSRTDQYQVALDSRLFNVSSERELVIDKAPYCLKLVKLVNNNFYQTLRNKLMWGIDKRN
jgi:NAD+ kinase